MDLNHDILIDYLATTLNVDTSGIEADTALFSSGHIDSFSMIDLIGFIETACNTTLKPNEITLDNLDSIGRILTFLKDRT